MSSSFVISQKQIYCDQRIGNNQISDKLKQAVNSLIISDTDHDVNLKSFRDLYKYHGTELEGLGIHKMRLGTWYSSERATAKLLALQEKCKDQPSKANNNQGTLNYFNPSSNSAFDGTKKANLKGPTTEANRPIIVDDLKQQLETAKSKLHPADRFAGKENNPNLANTITPPKLKSVGTSQTKYFNTKGEVEKFLESNYKASQAFDTFCVKMQNAENSKKGLDKMINTNPRDMILQVVDSNFRLSYDGTNWSLPDAPKQ